MHLLVAVLFLFFFFPPAFQNLCQELEAKFYEGTFNWESVKQHDAASLLKLFIRELPQPLLSGEYLKAFQAVQSKWWPSREQSCLAPILFIVLMANRIRYVWVDVVTH